MIKRKTTYQQQFVKTPFPCIWSNRDMSIFNFWSVSLQSAYLPNYTKVSNEWSLVIHGGGFLVKPLIMLYACFLDYFGAFLLFFAVEPFFKGLFTAFHAFNSSKHLSIAKKWQIRQKGLVCPSFFGT